MREGEKPSRLNREQRWDLMDVWETCAEFYIDTGGNGSHGLPARYQFIGTADGNQWDREDQYSIGQNMIDWNGKWDFKQNLSADGKFWEGEFAFPRQTVYAPEPLKDGMRWKIGFAASLMFPWQWCGLYGWPVTAVFRDEVPSIRLTGVEKGVMDKRATADVEIVNTTAAKFEGRMVLRVGNDKEKVLEKEILVSLEPGAVCKHAFAEDASAAKDNVTYTYTFMVLADNRSIFTFNRGLAYNDPENTIGLQIETSPEAFPMSCAYYPLSDRLVATVDIYDLPQREQIAAAAIAVKSETGKAIAEASISAFPYGRGSVEIALPKGMRSGKYLVFADIRSAAGESFASNQKTFERKDHGREFPWLGNNIGCEDIVPRIFTPVEVKRGDVICHYAKEIRLAGSALPAAISAAGVDLLAAPIHLRARMAGAEFVLESGRLHRGRISPTRAAYTGRASGRGMAADISYVFEYDSTARIEMTLAPVAGAVNIERLQLVIPFPLAAATHYMANGVNMRQSNQAGLISGVGTFGRVWDSRSVKAQKMTIGSFVPIVHVGNLSSGITWFADSDQGWWPSEKEPAIEIVRTDKGTVDLICNLAADAAVLDAPRTIVFGLCVAPVRKVSYYRTTAHTIGFGYEQESGRWDPAKTKECVYARMYPDDVEKFRKWVADLHASGQLEKCYVENSPADYWAHEFSYFASEWQSPFCRSAADNKLYWTERFIQDTALDGYYFDNLFCRLYHDPAVTTAYRLPDGRIQLGYDLWNMRQFLRRIRVLFEKYRDPTAIVFHNTDFQFAPAMAYADLVMGGENPLPSMGSPDYMDMWKRDWMDVMYNQPLWGYALSHLFHFPAESFKDELGEYDRTAAWKSFRAMQASMLAHGVEFWHGLEYKSFLMGKYRLFKALPGEMEFIPSWQAKGRFQVVDGDPDIDIALYRKPKAMLVIAVNYAKNSKRPWVWLDFPRLLEKPGKLEARNIYDLETMEMPGFVIKEGGRPTFTVNQPAHLSFDIQPRDFRVYLVVNEPVAQGAGF